MARRGALIVFEGCDRVGKSTQCQRLVEALKSSGRQAESLSFPSKFTRLFLENVSTRCCSQTEIRPSES